jgi:ATP-dependent helicase/nuclease subunit B
LKIVSENKGQMEINAPAGKVLLTARADRLDVYRNNDIGVVDYKTGSNVPSAKAVVSYHAPQLLLEGLIAQKGGFQKVKKGNVSALKYWKLGKNEKAVPEKDLEKIMLNGEERLTGIIAKYDFDDMPYVVNPAPKYCKDKDYEHLSRIREWGVSSGEDDESEDDE